MDPPPRTDPASKATVPVAKAAERLHITTAMPVNLPAAPEEGVPAAAAVSDPVSDLATAPMVTPVAAATTARAAPAITAPTPQRGTAREAGPPPRQAAVASHPMPTEDRTHPPAAAVEVIATAAPSPAAPSPQETVTAPTAATHQTATELPTAGRATPPLPGFPSRSQPAARVPESPKLVIGRIDVVVVAEAPPAPAARPAASDHGFMSRNYLKRL